MKTPTREWRLQAAAVTELRRMVDRGSPILFAGDMGGVPMTQRTASIAKLTGLEKGEPDLRVYLPGGRTCLIEYKGEKGRVSPEQKIRHATMKSLGFTVEVVKAASEPEAASRTVELVSGWLAEAANDNRPANLAV